jgi:hypothetical protein
MFLQEEPIAGRQWERSVSDWMILPAEAGSCSSFMVIILFIKGRDTGSAVIFLGLIGASLAMYIFNRYPAKVFVGDVGTLGIGATYATAAIIGNIAISTLIAILAMSLSSCATEYGRTQNQERLHKSPLNASSFCGGASTPTTSQNGGLTVIATASQPKGINLRFTRSRTSFTPF